MSERPAEPRPDAGPVWCVVVAAGSGSRYGAAKQYELIGGRRVLDRAVGTAAAVCDGVVVVLPADRVGTRRRPGGPGRRRGERRGDEAASVRAGWPRCRPRWRSCSSTTRRGRWPRRRCSGGGGRGPGGAGAVVPAVAVTDTVRSVDGGVVDRESLRAVQTPQGFRANGVAGRPRGRSRRHRRRHPGRAHRCGRRAGRRRGDQHQDHRSPRPAVAEAVSPSGPTLVETRRRELPHRQRLRRAPVLRGPRPSARPGRRHFPGESGLVGHSDADVVAHAVAESLLAPPGWAIWLSLPDSDERWRGADSLELLTEVVRLSAAAGWTAVNVDCSVIANVPSWPAGGARWRRGCRPRSAPRSRSRADGPRASAGWDGPRASPAWPRPGAASGGAS